MDYQQSLDYIIKSRLLATEYSIKAQYVSENAYKYDEGTSFEDMTNTEHYAQWVIDLAHNLKNEGKH